MSQPAGMSNDPFSLWEAAFCDVLKGYQPLSDLVKVGNWVILTGKKDDPFETSSGASDFPEVQIWAVGAGARGGQSVTRANDFRSWHQRYSVQIATNYVRTNGRASINVLRWHLLKALVRGEDLLRAPAFPYCTSLEYGDWTDTLGESVGPNDQRKLTGWEGVMSIEAQFTWSLAELLA